MDITLEEAYREACQALGEALVRERFLTQALAAANAKNADSERVDDQEPAPTMFAGTRTDAA